MVLLRDLKWAMCAAVGTQGVSLVLFSDGLHEGSGCCYRNIVGGEKRYPRKELHQGKTANSTPLLFLSRCTPDFSQNGCEERRKVILILKLALRNESILSVRGALLAS